MSDIYYVVNHPLQKVTVNLRAKKERRLRLVIDLISSNSSFHCPVGESVSAFRLCGIHKKETLEIVLLDDIVDGFLGVIT